VKKSRQHEIAGTGDSLGKQKNNSCRKNETAEKSSGFALRVRRMRQLHESLPFEGNQDHLRDSCQCVP
jgi:hypothetical protein